jgi:hypothetical protein
VHASAPAVHWLSTLLAVYICNALPVSAALYPQRSDCTASRACLLHMHLQRHQLSPLHSLLIHRLPCYSTLLCAMPHAVCCCNRCCRLFVYLYFISPSAATLPMTMTSTGTTAWRWQPLANTEKQRKLLGQCRATNTGWGIAALIFILAAATASSSGHVPLPACGFTCSQHAWHWQQKASAEKLKRRWGQCRATNTGRKCHCNHLMRKSAFMACYDSAQIWHHAKQFLHRWMATALSANTMFEQCRCEPRYV